MLGHAQGDDRQGVEQSSILGSLFIRRIKKIVPVPTVIKLKDQPEPTEQGEPTIQASRKDAIG